MEIGDRNYGENFQELGEDEAQTPIIAGSTGDAIVEQKKKRVVLVGIASVFIGTIIICIMLAITSSGGSSEATIRPMKLQSPFVANPLARCNNGEAPTWYFRESLVGRNENKWIIRFNDGGTCFSNSTCEAMWAEFTTSMEPATADNLYADIDGGVLNSQPELNPDFYDWNAVIMPYCSSDAWLGRRNPYEVTNNSPFYFNGYDNLMGLFDELAAKPGYNFNNAELVMITGSGLGGLAVISLGNAIRAKVLRLVPTAQVLSLSDSSWLVVSPGINFTCGTVMDCSSTHTCPISSQWQLGWDFWGTSTTLDSGCLLYAGSNGWACASPDVAYLFLEVSTVDHLLLLQSEYDMRNYMLHVAFPCVLSAPEMAEAYEEVRAQTVSSIALAGVRNRILTHCTTSAMLPSVLYYNIVFEGDERLAEKVHTWMQWRTVIYEEPCGGPNCNPTCENG